MYITAMSLSLFGTVQIVYTAIQYNTAGPLYQNVQDGDPIIESTMQFKIYIVLDANKSAETGNLVDQHSRAS
jgi:hypothetical protein